MMQHEQKAGRWETWRAIVVAPELGGLRATMTLDAIEFFDPRDGWVWRASHRTTCWCGGTPHDAVATSAPAAVLVALASFGRVHDKVVEEIRGPGERTTADRVASAEREVQRRCVLICESVALAQPDETDRRDLASDAAEAIRGMVFSAAGTDALEEQLAAALSELGVARRQLEIEHASHVATAAARDEARELAVRAGEMVERQARMLVRAPSFEDAMRLFIQAIVEPAVDAPNCAEWRGTMRGRGFVLSLQWADGKTPQELLSEAMREHNATEADRSRAVEERDAAEAGLRAAEAECDRLRALLARPFRVTPPTPVEVEAQHALGRGWRVEDLRGSVQHLRGTALNERFLSGRVPLRWSAEDAERRPCAWPPSEVLACPASAPTDEGDLA